MEGGCAAIPGARAQGKVEAYDPLGGHRAQDPLSSEATAMSRLGLYD